MLRNANPLQWDSYLYHQVNQHYEGILEWYKHEFGDEGQYEYSRMVEERFPVFQSIVAKHSDAYAVDAMWSIPETGEEVKLLSYMTTIPVVGGNLSYQEEKHKRRSIYAGLEEATPSLSKNGGGMDAHASYQAIKTTGTPQGRCFRLLSSCVQGVKRCVRNASIHTSSRSHSTNLANSCRRRENTSIFSNCIPATRFTAIRMGWSFTRVSSHLMLWPNTTYNTHSTGMARSLDFRWRHCRWYKKR